MPTITQLNQRHPMCQMESVGRLRALYEGGQLFNSKLFSFLPQRPGESAERYQSRLSDAHYRNYIGPIIDYFTSMLFSTRAQLAAKNAKTGEAVTDLSPYYGKITDDADGRGTKLDAVMKSQLCRAMVDGFSWIRVKEPEQINVKSRAEFDSLGLGDCQIEPLNYEQVIDWEDDGAGLSWAIVFSEKVTRDSISSPRDSVTWTWEYLTAEKIDTYQVSFRKSKPLAGGTEVPLVSSKPHGFGKVPLVCLDLPIGLHIASRLETPQLAHFRLSNAQTWSISQTCFAQPVFRLKDQNSMPAMGAGYGIIIGSEENVDWIAPPTDHLVATAAEVKSQKDEIFRIAHQMALGVENNSAAIGRSGESKKQDALSTRVVLLAYSRIVKETIERVLDLISYQRNDEIAWSVEGLDDFAAADIGAMLEALEQIEKIGGIPSPTFNALMKTRVSEALLPDISQAEKAQIRQEIKGAAEDSEGETEEDDADEIDFAELKNGDELSAA